jgi:hypothetical protein
LAVFVKRPGNGYDHRLKIFKVLSRSTGLNVGMCVERR